MLLEVHRESIMTDREILIELRDVRMHFPVKAGYRGLLRVVQTLKAVDGISLKVYKGEAFGLVGESGCGKSTTGKMMVRLLEPTSGKILFKGKDIFSHDRKDSSAFKKEVQIIFQDPFSSLDPRFTVGRAIMEPLAIARYGTPAERRMLALKLLSDVGLREEYFGKYPHEFSGGQKQRVGVARALALNPSLVVCDEPVSALDVSIQAQILNLMQDLQEKFGLTYFFISHNLSVVKHLCDRIAVMYLGKIVELADNEALFSDTLHPYTKALLNSIPEPNPKAEKKPNPIEGDVPSPTRPPSGCSFHTRCPHVMEKCRNIDPPILEYREGHEVRCHLYPTQ
jgi:oligopeptide/dipeptide ABC transporter ATP-binding protein